MPSVPVLAGKWALLKTWDQVGVKEVLPQMEELGYRPNQWVYDMVEAAMSRFTKVENGQVKYYHTTTKSYQEIPGRGDLIILDNLRAGSTVWGIRKPPCLTWVMAC